MKLERIKREHCAENSGPISIRADVLHAGFSHQKGRNMDGDMSQPKRQKGSKDHDRRAKFVDLAESRTINAIRAIRVIGKLGNRAHYEYSENDVKKIVGTLTREIENLKTRMTDKVAKSEVEFKL